MLKSIMLSGILVLYVFIFTGCSGQDDEKLAPTPLFNSLLTQPENTTNTSTEFSHSPQDITFPSKVGDVFFPHQMHVEEFEAECSDCHHNINANKLKTPHPDYFKSSQINCQVCHTGTSALNQEDYNCSKCHHFNPTNIDKEKISSKVAIHKRCWACHEMRKGKEASEDCTFCHSKKKKEMKHK